MSDLTHEEKRVSEYQGYPPPTIPALVTPDLSVDDLTLNWTERDLREIGAAAAGSSKRAKAIYQADIVEVFRRALDALKPGVN